MSEQPEPRFDIAHLGHVELLTPKPDESLWYFRDVLGMSEVAREGQSVYLRAWGEYELASLKLTEAKQPGVAHTAFRTTSPQALQRLVADVDASSLGRGWIDGDTGHGPAYQFTDPDGHLLEIYYETTRYVAPENQRPALKNQPQRTSHQGVGVRRLDHINFLAQTPKDNRVFAERHLGARPTERIVLDDGTEAGTWITFTNKAYDVVWTKDATGSKGRLHHIAFWVDNREDILRAADIYLENNLWIEFAPGKHAIAQGFFIYTHEPGGNRIEVASGSYLIFDPNWEPVIWTQADRARGQAWGQATIASFHTYGTPPLPMPEPMPELPQEPTSASAPETLKA